MAGNQGNNKILWQPEQIEFLKEHWQIMTAQQLSDALGIKRTKVREKKYELGLYLQKLEYWTAVQVSYLKDNYKLQGDTEIAATFNKMYHKEKGWTKKHIEKKRRYLVLKRTPEDLFAIKQKAKLAGVYVQGNKKMWRGRGVAKEKEIRYWRRKTIPKVAYIKINGKFVNYARWRYEDIHGELPKGMNVIYIDGDHSNIADDNLVAVTDGELAQLNSETASVGLSDNYIASMLSYNDRDLRKFVKQHPQLITLKRNSLLIKRIIKNETTDH